MKRHVKSRVTVAGAALAATALASLAHAGPATAATTYPVALNVNSGCSVTATSGSLPVTLSPGDTLQLTLSDNGSTGICSIVYFNPASASMTGWTYQQGAGVVVGPPLNASNHTTLSIFMPTIILTFVAGTSAGTIVSATGSTSASAVTTIASYTPGGGGSGTSSGSAVSTPAPTIQQVGMPSGGCSAVVDANLNWAGVASGGWGQSWAQWANGGNGGPVCTRTLNYSTAVDRWVTS